VQTAAAQPAPPPAAARRRPQASTRTKAAPAAPGRNPRPHDAAERLRAEYAEIAELAAQAMRLGVSIDAADALRRASPTPICAAVLDALAARAEATSVIAAAPSTPTAGDSPIVRRARERAAARA
jgi:capsid assembly protease